MSLPSPTLTVPSLAPDQIQFQGLVMGSGTPFGLVSLEGLGKPDVRSGNMDRPRARGAFPGLNLLKTRTPVVTMDVGPFSGPNSGLTNIIPDPSFEYDTVGSAPSTGLWTETTSGSITSNTFAVSTAWAQSGTRSLHIQGTHSNDTTAETIGCQTPSNTIPATAGTTYTVQATCNVIQGGPGNGILLAITWYTSGGAFISTSTSSVLSAGQLGIVTNSFTATAPANTAFAQAIITMQTVAANDVVEYYVDAIALAATGASFSYFDGDYATSGFQWSGTRGQSSSTPIAGWGRYGSYGNLAGSLAALRSAVSTEGSTEYPLWIQLPNFPLVACMARVVQKVDPKYDVTADIGGLIRQIPIGFEATDPYFYSAPTVATTIGLPTPGIGFTFPITFNWSFGGGSSANMASITNAGNVPCWPVLVITGPCLNPTVSNLTVTGNPTLSFNATLNAGDMLIVDCDMATILFVPSGSSVASPEPNILMPGSTFFGIPPGGNSILAFNSQDTSPAAGTLTVWSANAYDGLL